MLADGGAQTLPGRCSRPGLPFAPALSGTAEFEEAWNRLLPGSFLKGTMLADGGAQTLPGRCSRPGLPFAPALSGTAESWAEFEQAWNRLLQSQRTPPIQVF